MKTFQANQEITLIKTNIINDKKLIGKKAVVYHLSLSKKSKRSTFGRFFFYYLKTLQTSTLPSQEWPRKTNIRLIFKACQQIN